MINSAVRRAAPAFAALLALAAAGLSSAAETKAKAPAAGPTLKATLTGAAEKPKPGDPKGSGTVTLHINPAKDQVCYELQVKGVAPVTMAHIHQVFAVNGIVFEPRELSQGDEASIEYMTTLRPDDSLEDLSAQLLGDGKIGIKHVSWSPPKRI